MSKSIDASIWLHQLKMLKSIDVSVLLHQLKMSKSLDVSIWLPLALLQTSVPAAGKYCNGTTQKQCISQSQHSAAADLSTAHQPISAQRISYLSIAQLPISAQHISQSQHIIGKAGRQRLWRYGYAKTV